LQILLQITTAKKEYEKPSNGNLTGDSNEAAAIRERIVRIKISRLVGGALKPIKNNSAEAL
jgi:hypothetical protein